MIFKKKKSLQFWSNDTAFVQRNVTMLEAGQELHETSTSSAGSEQWKAKFEASKEQLTAGSKPWFGDWAQGSRLSAEQRLLSPPSGHKLAVLGAPVLTTTFATDLLSSS